MTIPEQFGEHYSADMSFNGVASENNLFEFFKEQMTQGDTAPYMQYQQSADTENAELFKAIAGNEELAPDVANFAENDSISQSNFVAATPAADSAASQLSAETAETDSAKIVDFLENDTEESNAPLEFLQPEPASQRVSPKFEPAQNENAGNAASSLPAFEEDIKQEAQKFKEQQNINTEQLFSNTTENDLATIPEILESPAFNPEETVPTPDAELISSVPAAAELDASIQLKQEQTALDDASEIEAEITPESALFPDISAQDSAIEKLKNTAGSDLNTFAETQNAADFPLHTLEKSDSRISQMVEQSKEEQRPQTTAAELQPDSAGTKEPAKPQEEKDFPTEFKLVDAEITIKGLGEGTMSGGRLVGMKGHSTG